MDNKRMFLGAARAKKTGNNAVIHYQCKSCLSFLASTTKWDHHLITCFSNTSIAFRPVGFRMVTFTTPTLPLERIRLEDNVKDAGATAESEQNPDPVSNSGSPSLVTRKQERPSKTPSSGPNFKNRPIHDKNGGGEEQIVPKGGRPKKTLHINTSTHKEQTTEAKLLVESLVADGEKRMGRLREDWNQTQFQSPEFPRINVKKSTIGKIKLKKAMDRPSKFSSVDSIHESNQFANNANLEKRSRKPAAQAALTKRRIKNAQNYVMRVRSFKYACPNCPAKFDTQRFYNIHVSNIHNCKTTTLLTQRIPAPVLSANNIPIPLSPADKCSEELTPMRVDRKPTKQKDSLNYAKYKALRKKQQNKKAATRYRQKKKEELTVNLAGEDELQTIHDELEKEKDKVGAELRMIRSLMRDMLRARKKRTVVSSTSPSSSRLTVWQQQEGIFVRNSRVPAPGNPGNPKMISEQCRNTFRKRASSFAPIENGGSDWEKESGISVDSSEMDDNEQDEETPEMPNERKIELERIHLDEDCVVKQEVDWKIKVEVSESQIILPGEPETS